jgi:cytidine deaminase
MPENERKLLEAALKAMKEAHVLWGLKVAAAVLEEDGKTYEGRNVESWTSGIGICAERRAIDHVVLQGNRKIKQKTEVMRKLPAVYSRICRVPK